MKFTRRPYRMTVRAASTADTGRRLVVAMQELVAERPLQEVTLEVVAERAGVTLQTLLRRFGSKAGLLAAAVEDGAARVASQRDQAVPGDLRGCVTNLFEHYEEWGDRVLRMLAQEGTMEEIDAILARGRRTHAAWVERVFARDIAHRRGGARKVLRAQLVALCDVYVWKLLRRDLGLARADAERALFGMLAPLTAEGGA